MNRPASQLQPEISPKAIVAQGATIHAGAWIGPDVQIGEDVVVGPGAVLGFEPGGGERVLVVGAGTTIGPHACIETGVKIGPCCQIGPNTYIGADSHLGTGVKAGPKCVLMPNCHIEDYVVLFADVHVCSFAQVRSHAQLMPGVFLLNDSYPPTGLAVVGPVIGESAIVATGAIIWPGVKLGYHSIAGACSDVRNDVADYMLVRGQPAKPVCDVRRIRTKIGDKWLYPYPWMRVGIKGEDLTKPVDHE